MGVRRLLHEPFEPFPYQIYHLSYFKVALERCDVLNSALAYIR